MSLISDIIHNTLLLEDVATNRVYDAIKNTYEVEINYRSNGEDIANGKRIIQPVAYGLTKAGNPVIRAFQPYGDTTTKVPSWKFFRLDRITSWTPFPDRTFPEPPAEYNADGEYNKTGDKTMSIMYSNANFGNKPIANSLNTQKNGPSLVKKDEPEVYKTETEKGIERLRKQLENPRYISDLVKKNNFDSNKNSTTVTNTSGPSTVNRAQLAQAAAKDEPEVYKTETEKGIERLRKQLENPRYISDLVKKRNFSDNKDNNTAPIGSDE